MDQVIVRESINAAWGVFNLSLAVLFCYRILGFIWEPGFYRDRGNRTIIAAAVYFLGEAGYRFSIFYLLQKLGTDSGYLGDFYIYAFTFFFMATAGGLCLIRQLTPVEWPHWIWFSIFILTFAVGVGVIQVELFNAPH